MAHIVILGAGTGGMPAAYELRAELGREHRITVVNAVDYFQFVPSNPWVAVGWRQRDSITFPIRPYLEKKNIAFVAQKVDRIDAEGNALELADGTTLAYDYLVITTGPRLAFEEVPGSGPDGHTHSICTVDHAQKTYEDYQRFLENPGPAIIGAMPAASCFGPAYEFAFILDTELRKREIRDQVPMTFVTSEPYIGHLGLDGVGDTKGLLESEMRKRHIKWITSARVTKFEQDKVFIEEIGEGGAVIKNHEVPSTYTMMLPPFRGVAAVKGVEGLVNPRGFVQIDKFQRNPTYPNIFAIGVCVAIPPIGSTPVPVGVPKTGFMIESMVSATARNIGQLLRGKPVNTKASWNAICLADFGDRGVAFVAQPQIPPRNVNWSADGKWVHFAKLAFEKFFIHKIRRGESEPFYERWGLEMLGVRKLKTVKEQKS